jgi:hypothetical protein
VPEEISTLLTFNGLNGNTGDYVQTPVTTEVLSRIAQGEKFDPDHLAELRFRHERENKHHLGLVEGRDETKLNESGWGVIFAKDTPPAVKEALKPLLNLREKQAKEKDERLYKEYNFRNGETKPDFLERHKVGAGVVDPTKMPYYMLLVGDPEQIPYRFQYQLDVQWAVGRIHFDTPEEYANYAQSVVDAETGKVRVAKRASFFATANPNDAATKASLDHLSVPMASHVSTDQRDWNVEQFLEEQATKQRLGTLLGGDATPAFLFAATHGMAWNKGDALQRSATGALVCQEWPGPKPRMPLVPPDFYFSGDDLSSRANLTGLIAMFFACYGAGIPRINEFSRMDGKDPGGEIAPAAFVSRLPQRMLGHPKGGALAVIGHVERAWGYSFQTNRGDRQLQTFQSALSKLLKGHPVGAVMEPFNSRYAEISQDLTSELEDIRESDKKPDAFVLSHLWTSNNDARNYAVVGDPAVRMVVVEDPAQELRPTITVRSIAKPSTVEEADSGPVAGAAPLQFGIFDSLQDVRANLTATLEKVVASIGTSLERTMNGLTTVEVHTYVSDRISDVKYEDGKFTGARLRGLSRVGIDGKTLVCVPETNGKVDEELWKIHSEAFERALANRTEMVKLAASAASSLLSSLKIT